MYSGNGPPSFSSAGIHTGDQEEPSTASHFRSSTDNISDQLPSYGAFGHGQGNSQNELLPDTVVYPGIGQAPSFSAIGHGQGNSHNNHDGTNFNHSVGYAEGYSDGGGAQSVRKVRHLGDSQPSGAGDPFSGGKLPSMGDVGRRENSQNMVPSIDDQAANLEAMAEVSLVGENFKMFYPMVYDKEKLKDDVYKK